MLQHLGVEKAALQSLKFSSQSQSATSKETTNQVTKVDNKMDQVTLKISERIKSANDVLKGLKKFRDTLAQVEEGQARLEERVEEGGRSPAQVEVGHSSVLLWENLFMSFICSLWHFIKRIH